MIKDEALVDAIAADYTAAAVTPRQAAMLGFVDKLTRRPGAMTREDVEDLRRADHSDADILAIVEVAGYYAYANRIADGLGVELEP